jgi:hypothetical protein
MIRITRIIGILLLESNLLSKPLRLVVDGLSTFSSLSPSPRALLSSGARFCRVFSDLFDQPEAWLRSVVGGRDASRPDVGQLGAHL